MRIDGREHEHGFVRAEGGTPFACATVTRSSREVEAGFQDFAIMKATGSGFVDYLQDEYTTLPPTTDRILATRMATTWRFEDGTLHGRGDYDAVAGSIRGTSRPPRSVDCGCTLNNGYMQLILLALAVIPELRISDLGPVDVSRFTRIPVIK